MFYWMKVFSGAGTAMLWLMLGIIIVVFYVISVLIDLLVMRKRAKTYTDKLMEYKSNNLN